MTINFLESFKTKIEVSRIDSFFCGGRSKSLICEAEKILKVKLPKDYVSFLEVYGAGGVFGFEVYGIPNEDLNAQGIPNAIWLTQEYRQKYNLFNNLIIISEAGEGDYYVINCDEKESGKILIWKPFNNQLIENETCCKTFGEFLILKLDNAIENWMEE